MNKLTQTYNCMVAQSGGPTSAINASLAGVVHQVLASKQYDICYGSINGIVGILNENYLNFNEILELPNMSIEKLKLSPSMYLGSCRYKIKSFQDDPATYEKIFEQFEKKNIKAFFYIGGNDSMDTVMKLSAYSKQIGSDVRIIGIPKTIDNDLCVTDHTPGFGSAAKYIATSVLEIAHDTFIYPVDSVTIIEIMGRDAGWLTAASALARNDYQQAPHLIYLPEAEFDDDQFIADVKHILAQRQNVIVAVSEGIRYSDGTYVAASGSAVDQFGHQQLSGAGKTLEYLVKEKIGVKVRSVEVNVLQRCAAHLASATDLTEAFAQGQKAVLLSLEGVTGAMVTLERISNEPYEVTYSYYDVSKIANETKAVPRNWINAKGNDITEECLAYLLPLIQGEVSLSFTGGLPDYMPISHLNACRSKTEE